MKSSKIISLFMFCLLLLNFQCDEDDTVPFSTCEEAVVLDNALYQSIASDFYSLISVDIDQDCLNVNISASGCGGNTWVLTLVDSEAISESLPPQRDLKLSLSNNEACLAVFTKEQSFDLTRLRLEDTNNVLLNIEDFPELLSYSY